MEENINMDWKSVPVYKDSPTAAREKNELDAFRASNHANQACAKAIVETINKNWNGTGLKARTTGPGRRWRLQALTWLSRMTAEARGKSTFIPSC